MNVKDFCSTHKLKMEIVKREFRLEDSDGKYWPHYWFNLKVSRHTTQEVIFQEYKAGIGCFKRLTVEDRYKLPVNMRMGWNSRGAVFDNVFHTITKPDFTRLLREDDNYLYQSIMTTWMEVNDFKPEIHEVVECIKGSVEVYMAAITFEDFASEYGYDVDSIKANRIFNSITSEARTWVSFLGGKVANELLECEES